LVASDAERGPRPERLKGHLSCPFCGSYDVSRLYVGSLAVDCCECVMCGTGWEESAQTGAYRGRVSRASVVIAGELGF
jgi:ribosomal protein L37AE/L43A